MPSGCKQSVIMLEARCIFGSVSWSTASASLFVPGFLTVVLEHHAQILREPKRVFMVDAKETLVRCAEVAIDLFRLGERGTWLWFWASLSRVRARASARPSAIAPACRCLHVGHICQPVWNSSPGCSAVMTLHATCAHPASSALDDGHPWAVVVQVDAAVHGLPARVLVPAMRSVLTLAVRVAVDRLLAAAARSPVLVAGCGELLSARRPRQCAASPSPDSLVPTAAVDVIL